ncbi:hypothetical protein VPH35_081247 [Triticum aestivum]
MASDEGSWRLAGENRVVAVKRDGRKKVTSVVSGSDSGSGSERAFVGKAPTINQMTKKKKKKNQKGLPQAALTAGKRLLPYEEIMTILAMKDEPRESDTAEDKKVVAEWLEFQEEVKREYMAKGYVEMDEECFVEREKKKLLLKEAWDKIDFGGLVFLDSDDDSYVVKDRGGPRWADGIVRE